MTEAPFAAEGGLPAAPEAPDDPFLALDDLMVIVEALCPVWPERPLFVDGGKMLL